jgi:glycosyl-4,4'-diaponeurosporenoate acyltransferase
VTGHNRALVIPLVELPKWAMVVLDVAVWGGWSAVVGYWAHRRPITAFADDSARYRLRAVEANGRLYERLGIKRWKDRLPEAGGLFTGGFSKRSMRTRDRAVLERFVVETRRAEWTHWTIMSATPVFLVWNWWWVELLMVVYALAANLPCLLVQRYNRARLARLLGAQ